VIEGTFVVIEGIDGAGSTTQAARLAQAIRSRGLPAHVTREPSDGPFGMLLRQILTGRLVVRGETGPRPPGWASLALLFSADRLDHLQAEVLPNLRDGVTVVSDRYYHSTIAYQSLASDDPDAADWIQNVNAKARRPDLTVILDVPGSVAARRRATRHGGDELFDHPEFQERLAAFYRSLPTRLPQERIVLVDGSRSEDEVHAAVLAAFDAVRRSGAVA
jgi:dTMP kinase